eukprot:scaffold70488_cov59-Phaeocystis_antarctica.AAC.7
MCAPPSLARRARPSPRLRACMVSGMGQAPPWECRAAQSRQAHPEEAQEPSWGTAKGGTLPMLESSKSKSFAFSSIRAGVVERASTAQPRCSEWRSETWLGLGLGLGPGLGLGSGTEAMRCTTGSESRPMWIYVYTWKTRPVWLANQETSANYWPRLETPVGGYYPQSSKPLAPTEPKDVTAIPLPSQYSRMCAWPR